MTPDNKNRTPITLLAKGIRQEGPLITAASPNGELVKDNEVRAKWAKVKPELYAITAILTDRIVDKALQTELAIDEGQVSAICQQLDEFGVYDPIKNIAGFTKMSLRNVLMEEVDDLGPSFTELDPTSPLHRTYARYFELVDFHQKQVRPSKEHNVFIVRGITNASDSMANLLELTYWVHERRFPEVVADPRTLTRIAANSYPVLTDLAMLHLDEFSRAHEDITQVNLEGDFHRRYNPDKFILKERTNGLALALRESLDQYSRDFDEERYGPKVGCPAMVNFGDGSAISKFWQWHVKFAPTIYEHFIKSFNQEPNFDNYKPTNASLEDLLKIIEQAGY